MKTYVKYGTLALAVLLVLSLVVCGGTAIPADAKGPPPTDTPEPTDTPPATNTPLPSGTYYVDCSAGTNGDGSQSSPWNDLATVNATTFAPGSAILLKRGTTCSGQLWPKGSGTSGNPIVLDAYGTGAKPIVDGGGIIDTGAVILYNQEYWEIRNLDVVNLGPASDSPRLGIQVEIADIGVGTYYRILNNTVRDVNGDHDKEDPHGGGISFLVSGSATETKFADVLIEGNTVHTVDFFGIATWSSWWCRPSANCTDPYNWYGWDTPFIIRNNTVYDIGGDAIVPIITRSAVVEYNVAYDFHNRSNDCAAGMWPWDADDTVFQFNESYLGRITNSTCDGQGFDIDYGTDGTIMQYNYSHDNEGGFMLLCGPNAGGNTNAVVRYNISQDDEAMLFNISGPAVTDAMIYNNTFYVPAGNNTTIVNEGNWNGTPTSAYFYNNIFYILGGGGYNLSTGAIQFDYNIFYGNHPASEPNDAHKITDDPMLVNPGSGGLGLGSVDGYKLQDGSPALQAGKVIANNGGKDYWGNTLPQNCPPDIGAHQLSTDDNCPTPTPIPTPAPPIPQDSWTLVYVDSEETVGEDGHGVNAFDGDTMSIWHTEWKNAQPPHPHEIQIDLGDTYDLVAFRYLPRQFDNLNGNIGQYEFYVSTGTSDWGTAVATGTFADTGTEKEVYFSEKTGRYIRLVALTEAGDRGPWTSAAEINVVGTQGTPGPTDTPAPPTDTPEPQLMHVGDITMSFTKLGVNYSARATVTILDTGDLPVGTATVYGEFTGATSDSVSGDTAGDGTVTLESSTNKNGGTWTFCVTDVVKSGWIYDDNANVETCDQITAP